MVDIFKRLLACILATASEYRSDNVLLILYIVNYFYNYDNGNDCFYIVIYVYVQRIFIYIYVYIFLIIIINHQNNDKKIICVQVNISFLK